MLELDTCISTLWYLFPFGFVIINKIENLSGDFDLLLNSDVQRHQYRRLRWQMTAHNWKTICRLCEMLRK